MPGRSLAWLWLPVGEVWRGWWGAEGPHPGGQVASTRRAALSSSWRLFPTHLRHNCTTEYNMHSTLAVRKTHCGGFPVQALLLPLWWRKKRVGASSCQWFTWTKSPFWFSCSLPEWPWQLAWPLSATQVSTDKALMWHEQHCHQMNAHEAK